MPCGARPLVKNWDHQRNLKKIKPSRYEQNEASVKLHWKKVLRDLELSYKDEKFWDSSAGLVAELVGPKVFKRIAKIFDLPTSKPVYKPKDDTTSTIPSEEIYKSKGPDEPHHTRTSFTVSSVGTSSREEEEEEEVEEEEWSKSSEEMPKESRVYSTKSMSKARILSKAMSMNALSRTSHKAVSRTLMRSYSSRSRTIRSQHSSLEESATTRDDLEVHPDDELEKKFRQRRKKNPFFEMLYCNESETDMIKWKSKYKQKTLEVSASDEFNKKAEILTKKIALEFYEWWVNLGTLDFKSEIKRPEDIEALFQVWFDEHASRGLVLDPKILPCVLQSIADAVGVPKQSCPNVLARQVAFDIKAETSPAHVLAFGSCLPQKLKHIPPNNNTKKLWHCVKIPQDLKSMACVWDDIQHLTSTKAFQSYLRLHPQLPMPPCLRSSGALGDKKQLFVVPSDFVLREGSGSTSAAELNLPVSQFSLELKEVLSKLMNQ